MGQFFSNKYQKYRKALTGTPITEDRLCVQCDYNVRGLKIGGACPECGTAITLEDPMRDALSDAPVRVIRNLCIGFWLAMGSMAGIVISPFAVGMMLKGSAPDWGIIIFVAAVIWMAGVWLITRPIDTPIGQRHGFGRRSKLRISALLLQLPWPLLTIMMLVSSMSGGAMPSYAMGLTWPLLFTGLAGISVLALQLMGLADWMYDANARRKLNIAMWGIPFTTAGLLLGQMTTFFAFFSCMMFVLFVFSMGCFWWAMFRLGNAVTWSLRHAREGGERDARLRAKREGKFVEDETPDERARRTVEDWPINGPGFFR